MTKKMIAVMVASLFAASPISAQGPAGADAASAAQNTGLRATRVDYF